MIDRPHFKSSRRGYEPEEVDAFIESQNRILQAAKKDAAERSVELTKLNAALTDLRGQLGQQSRVMADLKKNSSPTPAQTFTDLGERIGQILALADEEAADMRARAATDADEIRERANRAANELKATTSTYAEQARARADEESVRIIAQANREAQAIVAEAQSVTAAQRQEAAAEFEAHRLKASTASAELEVKLAARREAADLEFEVRRQQQEAALGESETRLRQLTERAEHDAQEMRARAERLLENAQAQADQIVSEARDHASRLREESDRELSAASAQRDAITAQLGNVRQMLATLGGGALVDTLNTPDKPAQPAPPADATQVLPATGATGKPADKAADDSDNGSADESGADDAEAHHPEPTTQVTDEAADAEAVSDAADTADGDRASGEVAEEAGEEKDDASSNGASYYQRTPGDQKVGASNRGPARSRPDGGRPPTRGAASVVVCLGLGRAVGLAGRGRAVRRRGLRSGRRSFRRGGLGDRRCAEHLGRGVAGLARLDQPREQRADDASEGPAWAVAVEDSHLELPGVEHAAFAVVAGAENVDGEAQHLAQGHAGAPGRAEALLGRVAGTAHRHEAAFVGDRPVVGEPKDLVAVAVDAHLGDHDLDLEGLGLLGEDGAERLGVRVGQRASRDVGAVVGVAAQVGVADARHAQALELVVAADGGEGDAVVDLRHLVQRPGRVLGDEGDAPVVAQDDDRAPARNSLAREVSPVLHDLLGRDVEGHAHRAPPGLSRRAATTRSTCPSRTSWPTNRAPEWSTSATVGQIWRPRSGPPVAESSSAAS